MAAAKKTGSKKGQKGHDTYFPAKTFDDDLVGLVTLMVKEGWSFSNVDLAQLQKDAQDQRQERLDHDALEGQYLKVHKKFGTDQAARHKRWSAALNAVRGAFKNDSHVLKQIDGFKRSVKRRSTQQVAAVTTGGEAAAGTAAKG
jgi:hypothetical protein